MITNKISFLKNIKFICKEYRMEHSWKYITQIAEHKYS